MLTCEYLAFLVNKFNYGDVLCTRVKGRWGSETVSSLKNHLFLFSHVLIILVLLLF